MSDGFNPQCKFCTKKYYVDNRERKKEYYLENRDRIINNQKLYDKQNRDKINTRMNNYLIKDTKQITILN